MSPTTLLGAHCTPPGLPVPAKVEQRGWAAKRGTQWHMLYGFLGTAWRTVALLCQASLYCRSPLGCGSPGHSSGWKGISLGFNWKDASLNLVNARIPHSWAVVAELLTMAEAGPLSWDEPLCGPQLIRRLGARRRWGWGSFKDDSWRCSLDGRSSCDFSNRYAQKQSQCKCKTSLGTSSNGRVSSKLLHRIVLVPHELQGKWKHRKQGVKCGKNAPNKDISWQQEYLFGCMCGRLCHQEDKNNFNQVKSMNSEEDVIIF